MTTVINLEAVTVEVFEAIVANLVGTDCTMEFSNYTEEHEKLALSYGLTIVTSDTLEVMCEPANANVWC